MIEKVYTENMILIINQSNAKWYIYIYLFYKIYIKIIIEKFL